MRTGTETVNRCIGRRIYKYLKWKFEELKELACFRIQIFKMKNEKQRPIRESLVNRVTDLHKDNHKALEIIFLMIVLFTYI